MELISIDTKDHTYMTNRLALMEPGEREKQKRTIIKMYAQAAKIKRQDAVAYLNQPERKNLDQEREEWRITRQEAYERVHALRTELDSYREQIDAVPFDIASEDIPNCLDGGARKYIVELVEGLNPLIAGLFQRCDEVARKHGADEEMDYNAQLFDLKRRTAETGFYIGVLAGAIFAGCANEQIDRFERGLLFALRSNRSIVKD